MKQVGAATTVSYFHRDQLGSTTAVTNEAGAVIERLAYESFGKRRFASGGVDPNNAIAGVNTDRGYTNHEHLEELGLIHMNGRIYDPVLGRFMSADPHIQAPADLQSYNRYSYVMNNPLGLTDPSGYFSLFGYKILPGLFNNKNAKVAVVAAAAIYTGGLVQSAIYNSIAGSAAMSATAAGTTLTSYQVGAMYAGSMAAGGATAGAVIGAATGGTLQSTLRGAVYGAVSGGVAGTFAQAGMLGQMIGSGVNGYMQTGNPQGFIRGFVSGGIPQDLGFDQAYLNNGAANISIGIVLDGIRGGIVSGNSEGAKMGIVYGQFNNAVGHSIGVTTGEYKEFKGGAFIYVRGGGGAITLGNVINGGVWWLSEPNILPHERDHIFNQLEQSLGVTYIPVHAMELTIGKATEKLFGCGGYLMEEHVNKYSYSSLGGLPCGDR